MSIKVIIYGAGERGKALNCDTIRRFIIYGLGEKRFHIT